MCPYLDSRGFEGHGSTWFRRRPSVQAVPQSVVYKFSVKRDMTFPLRQHTSYPWAHFTERISGGMRPLGFLFS